jgi:hypothetical protein
VVAVNLSAAREVTRFDPPASHGNGLRRPACVIDEVGVGIMV